MEANELSVRCCIVGGGPAGMMLGFLLARAGVDVLVLEKHADFLRDFRGDTIHPSTLQVMHELGLLDEFLKLPHQKAETLGAQLGDTLLPVADFRHLPTVCKFIALMPQWDFLNFLAEHGRAYPGFALRQNAAVTELVEERGRIVGLRAITEDGPLTVRARLVVGADGRHSTVRERAGLHVRALGAPMDVLWFRLSLHDSDPQSLLGQFAAGQIFIRINRGDHWQLGYVIPKGDLEDIRAAGLDTFRRRILALMPFAADRLGEIASWDDVKLLTVAVDRLDRWYRDGLLCIGDAAHTMSPVGGVGINLAIQDAVAAANLLAKPLAADRLAIDDLRRVQERRELPAKLTQQAQIFIQNRVIRRVLGDTDALKPPLILRLLARFPPLRRLPARMVGMGVRPEHIAGAAAR